MIKTINVKNAIDGPIIYTFLWIIVTVVIAFFLLFLLPFSNNYIKCKIIFILNIQNKFTINIYNNLFVRLEQVIILMFIIVPLSQNFWDLTSSTCILDATLLIIIICDIINFQLLGLLYNFPSFKMTMSNNTRIKRHKLTPGTRKISDRSSMSSQGCDVFCCEEEQCLRTASRGSHRYEVWPTSYFSFLSFEI